MVNVNLSFEFWTYTKVCLFQINMLGNVISTSSVSTNSQSIIKETVREKKYFSVTEAERS